MTMDFFFGPSLKDVTRLSFGECVPVCMSNAFLFSSILYPAVTSYLLIQVHYKKKNIIKQLDIIKIYYLSRIKSNSNSTPR